MSETVTPQILALDNAFHGVRELLQDRISPAIGDPFAAQMARLSCLLLKVCANAVDDAAELRVYENAAIREVLAEASYLVTEPLAAQLRIAAVSTDPGLKISVLDHENNRLRRLLVQCHDVLDGLDDGEAKSLSQKIWRNLESMEAKRAPRE